MSETNYEPQKQAKKLNWLLGNLGSLSIFNFSKAFRSEHSIWIQLLVLDSLKLNAKTHALSK